MSNKYAVLCGCRLGVEWTLESSYVCHHGVRIVVMSLLSSPISIRIFVWASGKLSGNRLI